MNSTLILAGKLAGTAALATGALVTGVSATHSATASDTPSATAKKVHCGKGFGKATPELKSALKAARSKPKGEERRKAIRAIHKDAVKGKYGDAAEIRSLHMRVSQLRLRAIAPDSLKSALKAARSKPAGTERKEALAAIRKDAVAGKYGDKIQKATQKRADHQQACQAQRADRKDKLQQKDESGSSSQTS